MRTLVALGAIACLMFTGQLRAQEDDGPVRIRVFAHYVSWYSQQRPGVSDHQWSESSLFPLPPHRGPGAGEGYTSQDSDIIRLQNEDFVEYGITPLASWWGPGHQAGDAFLDAYLSVPAPVQIGVLYEVTGLLQADDGDHYDFDDPVNGERFVSHVRYLKERYFDRFPERFVKVDGKPVVFIWLSSLFRGDFEHAVADVRDDVYLIGSEISPYPPGGALMDRLPVLRGLDAVSSYGVNYEDFHDGRLSPVYVAQLLSSFMLWAPWLQAHAPGVDIIAPLSFASNDTGIPERAPHSRPFFSTPDEAAYAAEQYREFISRAYDGCVYTNIRPMVNITSYNELVEGTAIEASRSNPDVLRPYPEDIGWSYLQVVRDALRLPIAQRPVRCPQ